MDRRRAALIEALRAIAPGRPLRDGLDRILQANMGALIIVGDGPEVLSICSGGFLLDAEFTPQRLAELAKMDGAIILASDASRIARANVHLVPSPNVPTSETGTRHRTAERVARSIEVPVIAVSEDLSVITMYRSDYKHALESVARLLGRANQALSTLERYRDRLDSVTSALTASEVEDLVTVRDVVTVLQRAEMVRRIAEEIEGYVVELGTDGRLVLLQLEELMAGVEDERRQVVRDYLPAPDGADGGDGDGRGDYEDRASRSEDVVNALASLPTEQLLDPQIVAGLLAGDAGSVPVPSGGMRMVPLSMPALEGPGPGPGLDPVPGGGREPGLFPMPISVAYDGDGPDLDVGLQPRGYRLLSRIPRVPEPTVEATVDRFGTLQKVMRSGTEELLAIPGIDAGLARTIKDGLARLAESSIFDRYT